MTERASILAASLVTLGLLLAGCSRDDSNPAPTAPPTVGLSGPTVTVSNSAVLGYISADPSPGATLDAGSSGTVEVTVKYDLGASSSAHLTFLVLGEGPTGLDYVEAWTGSDLPNHTGTLTVPFPYTGIPANSTLHFQVSLVGNASSGQIQVNYKTAA